MLTELTFFYPEYQSGGSVHKKTTNFYQPLLYYPELKYNFRNRYLESVSLYPQFPFDVVSTGIFHYQKVVSFSNYPKLYRVGRLEFNSVNLLNSSLGLSVRLGYEMLYNNAPGRPANLFSRIFLGTQLKYAKSRLVLEYGVPIREYTYQSFYRIIPRLELIRQFKTVAGSSHELGLGYYGNIYLLKHRKLGIPESELDNYLLRESVQSIYLKWTF